MDRGGRSKARLRAASSRTWNTRSNGALKTDSLMEGSGREPATRNDPSARPLAGAAHAARAPNVALGVTAFGRLPKANTGSPLARLMLSTFAWTAAPSGCIEDPTEQRLPPWWVIFTGHGPPASVFGL